MSPESEKSNKNKNDKNDSDDEGSVDSVEMLGTKKFPKAYDNKTTFGEYLHNVPREQKNIVIHDIMESLEKTKTVHQKLNWLRY